MIHDAYPLAIPFPPPPFLRCRCCCVLRIKFDRSGRSEGIAWVTYGNEEHAAHAKEAFDGALAKGQFGI